MESFGNIFDEEWMNLGSMFFCNQDSDHYFPGHELFSSQHEHGLDPSILWPSSSESNSSNSSAIDDQTNLSYPPDHDLKSNFYNYLSQESSNSKDSPSYPCHDIFQFSAPSNTPTESNQSNSLCLMEGDGNSFLLLAQDFLDEPMEDILSLKQDETLDDIMKNSIGQHVSDTVDLGQETFVKRKYNMHELPNALEEGNTVSNDKNPKKKTRVSKDNKGKKNLSTKKNKKTITSINSNEDDGGAVNHQGIDSNGRENVPSSSSCSSEEESNASQELDGGANKLTAKTIASRGAATDPQSIYARKRRERINERLKILQTLVPNGTKVDMSTMLEEAVHYVKFLQLQIKLLSSDDKWMYAPIAYNGMDMGLYHNISQNL